jgi:hypothetical protein
MDAIFDKVFTWMFRKGLDMIIGRGENEALKDSIFNHICYVLAWYSIYDTEESLVTLDAQLVALVVNLSLWDDHGLISVK